MIKRYEAKIHVVSLDPGVQKVAIATWDLPAGLLVEARLVQHSHELGTERAQKWLDMAEEVAIYLPKTGEIDFVCEIPQVYTRQEKGQDPNDLIDLAGVVGACVARAKSEAINAKVQWSPMPKEWKGQLPKAITQARVDAKLSAEEKSKIVWPTSKTLYHDVYDAIHLGMIYLESNGLRDFSKK